MDEKLALSPKMVIITVFLVMSGVFRLQRGGDSALSTSELPYNVVCLHEPPWADWEWGSVPPISWAESWLWWEAGSPKSLRLALRVGSICFGKKFGIRQQRVKMLILFTTERLQRISGCGSDFFLSFLLSSQLCLM